jgi:hypothetical protein
MSKELADSIVIAARKMVHHEVLEVISVIRFHGARFYILCPKYKEFQTFEDAYNYLAMKGYHKVSSDENADFKKSLEVAKEVYHVVMVMSKKLKKDSNSTDDEDEDDDDDDDADIYLG